MPSLTFTKEQMNEIFPPGIQRQIWASDLQQILQKLYAGGYLGPTNLDDYMRKDVYDTDDNGIIDSAYDADRLGNTDAVEYLLKDIADEHLLRLNGIQKDSGGNPLAQPDPGSILIFDGTSWIYFNPAIGPADGDILVFNGSTMKWDFHTPASSQVDSIVAGTNVVVDATDPVNPIINVPVTLDMLNSFNWNLLPRDTIDGIPSTPGQLYIANANGTVRVS